MRTPIKGRPFSEWSDEKLEKYTQLFCDFHFAYKNVDESKHKLICEILKDLEDEFIDRLSEDAPPEKKKLLKNGIKSLRTSVDKKFPKKISKKPLTRVR